MKSVHETNYVQSGGKGATGDPGMPRGLGTTMWVRREPGDPFVRFSTAEACRIGWPVKTMPPSEKYHRMGVSSNKQVRRLYYACFTEWSVGLDKCDTDKGIY
jgi:hypothetical protein